MRHCFFILPIQLRHVLGGVLLAAMAGCGGEGDDNLTPPDPASGETWLVPDTVTLPVGYSATFSLKGLPAGGPAQVNWSVAGAGCAGAGCGTINSQGVFTAPSLVPDPPMVTVTAAAASDARILGQASVDIVPTAVDRFTRTGSMNLPRALHTATRLQDGRVLVAGGETWSLGNDDPDTPDNLRSTAELYDPATGTFTPTGALHRARAGHSATLLNDGQVLITGPAGYASAELFDPVTGTFSLTGSMLKAQRRAGQAATLLPDGKVLVAGAEEAELYDPVTRSFLPAAAYAAPVDSIIQSVPLNDGRVLLLTSTATQIYDPAGNYFALAAGHPYLYDFTATPLVDGRVLIAGGSDELSIFRDAQLFDPATGNFSVTGSLLRRRMAQSATRLGDGRVLVLGGQTMNCIGNACWAAGATESAEVYGPDTGQFAATGSLNVSRALAQATVLEDGNVLVTGGYNTTRLAGAEVFHAHP